MSMSGSGKFLDSSLLILLAEQPDHGYALLRRLEIFGLGISDEPGALYRRLQSLERKGLVEYRLIHSDKGPRKKVYSATPQGLSVLRDWAPSLKVTHQALTCWLDTHATLFDDSSEELVVGSG